jgi:uncharacterized protein with GYD domain
MVAETTEEGKMAIFIVLSDWTGQGVAKFEDSVERFESGIAELERVGVKVRDFYWTLGDHDMVSIAEAPDAETLAGALLKLESLGNVRTTTWRAFSADEMRAVIAKAG